MKTTTFKYLIAGFTLALMSFVWFDKPPMRVYLIGDSTVENYPRNKFPITGWGMPFANYFDAGVTIHNNAIGGRSTRSFIAEGRWKTVVDSLSAGDYLFIQFGHNDEDKSTSHPERFTPVPDYTANLIKFVTEARAKNAIPILVTPVSRLHADKDGNMLETHKEYTKAVIAVGEKYNVPVIDLDKKSREMYQAMGAERTGMMFMHLDSAEHPNYPIGWHDNTHFNEYGARRLAELILNDIKEKHLELADRIVIGKNKPTVNPQAK